MTSQEVLLVNIGIEAPLEVIAILVTSMDTNLWIARRRWKRRIPTSNVGNAI